MSLESFASITGPRGYGRHAKLTFSRSGESYLTATVSVLVRHPSRIWGIARQRCALSNTGVAGPDQPPATEWPVLFVIIGTLSTGQTRALPGRIWKLDLPEFAAPSLAVRRGRR